MPGVLARLAPVLRLTRVTTAFAAVANVWFVILWTRGHDAELITASAQLRDKPLWALLGAGAANAIGLFAYGASLNDVMDMHRDRALRLDRPIGEGQLAPEAVVLAVAGSLIVSVLGATAFGTHCVVVTLLVALAILVFNVLGKFVPAIGMVLLGLIYAGHMLAPNVELRFLLPIWVVMTHALVLGGLTHRLSRKSPRISRRAIVFAAAGWLGVSTALVWLGIQRAGSAWPGWVAPMAWVWPTVLAAVFVVLAARRVSQLGAGPRAAEKIWRYGALWISLYACGWLFGVGEMKATMIMGALAAVGFAGMTVLRELYALAEHPVGYRR